MGRNRANYFRNPIRKTLAWSSRWTSNTITQVENKGKRNNKTAAFSDLIFSGWLAFSLSKSLVNANRESMRKATIKYKEWSLNSNDGGVLGKHRHFFLQLHLGIKGDTDRLIKPSVEIFTASFALVLSFILLTLWIFPCDFLKI